MLAAGSWSLLVEGNGLPAGAVRPVRGQIAVLDTRPPLLSRVVFSGHGYVVPRADGRILCGSTMEEVGFEKAVTAGGLRHVLDVAIGIAPALARAPVVETWSNFRPASPDGEPILGPGTVPGLLYATGHTRNGILLAPVTADAIAAAVLGPRPRWTSRRSRPPGSRGYRPPALRGLSRTPLPSPGELSAASRLPGSVRVRRRGDGWVRAGSTAPLARSHRHPPSMMCHMPIMPMSSCSRMWQWNMVMPVKSRIGRRSVTLPTSAR